MTDTALTIPNIAPNYTEQCERISEKLIAARRYDIQRKVFGANNHDYQIGPVLSEDEIAAFEAKHDIKLPAPYAAFLTKVGHDGPKEIYNAAGPFLGILPLADSLEIFGSNHVADLAAMPAINSTMSPDYWDELTGAYHQDALTDDASRALKKKIFQGLLPICHQVDQSYAVLVMSGPDRGRIVNFDTDLYDPSFAYEANFLDWYERWLDEVLSGVLITDEQTWFGYTMGGTDEELLDYYFRTKDDELKTVALEGLFKLPRMRMRNGDVLLKICRAETGERRLISFELLIKHGFYSWAQPVLKDFMHGSELDFHVACKSLLDHADYHANDWADVIGKRLPSLTDVNAFGVASSLLAKADGDWSADILDFVHHEEAGFRHFAMKALGAMEVSSGPVKAAFMKGMADKASGVVSAALSAHETEFSEHFVTRYYEVAQKANGHNRDLETALAEKIEALGFEDKADFIRAYESGALDARALALRTKEASKTKDRPDIGQQATKLIDRLTRNAKELIGR